MNVRLGRCIGGCEHRLGGIPDGIRAEHENTPKTMLGKPDSQPVTVNRLWQHV